MFFPNQFDSLLNPGSAPWSNLGDEVSFPFSLLTIFLPNYY